MAQDSSSKENAEQIGLDRLTLGGNAETTAAHQSAALEDYTSPDSIATIKLRVQTLLTMVPTRQETIRMDDSNKDYIVEWCSRVHLLIRQFNLLCNFIGMATYSHESVRSGSTKQNIKTLNDEMNTVSSKLSLISSTAMRVLYPSQSKIKSQSVENDGVKVFSYANIASDPDNELVTIRHLCFEAMDKRELMELSLKMAISALEDYEKAEQGATSGQSNSMAY